MRVLNELSKRESSTEMRTMSTKIEFLVANREVSQLSSVKLRLGEAQSNPKMR